MISLVQYIKESSIERWCLKVPLRTFLDKSIEGVRFPMSKFKNMIVDSLNKYSDGGPKKDDWLDNNMSKEISFTAYTESIGSRERITIEVQDPDYDMMKMCFSIDDSIGNKMFEYIKTEGRKQ